MGEIGSFIELQFNKGKEFYAQETDIARLNSGRAAIWHALRILNCNTIWLPYYQCDTVRDFLTSKHATIKYYHIDEHFNPTDLSPAKNEAILFVNYFGIMSRDRMQELSDNYANVIIDNSQAFFCSPLPNCLNIYSCRKFIGVPDGAYVIGKGAGRFVESYEQGFSSDTSLFLLQRIEYGCEGKSYESRMKNEHRIDSEDVSKMSLLTHTILCGTDYDFIQSRRQKNFQFVSNALNQCNKLNVLEYLDESCVPMVYPLVIENDALIDMLLAAKHFQGHWWSYLLKELPENSFEYWLSRFVIPITIDQRYGTEEIDGIMKVIKNNL